MGYQYHLIGGKLVKKKSNRKKKKTDNWLSDIGWNMYD
jgi:hypothetical protein